MPIKLNGTTNGSIELNVPDAVGSDLQITLPATAGEIVVKDSSGNVGIGKSSPHTTLDIYDATEPYIYLQNSTTGTGVGDGFSIVEYGLDTYINNREAGNMLFYNNSAERMRIDSLGKIMLGTTTPGFNAYGDRFTIATSSHCGMTLRGGATSDCEIFFADGTTLASRYSGGIRYAHNTDHMQFTVNASERMRINSSGNLGIGNSSPAQKLHVSGKIRFGTHGSYYGLIEHEQSSTGANIYTSQDSGGHIFKQGITSFESMRIDGGGRFQVGKNTGASNSGDGLLMNPGTAPFYSAHKSYSGNHNGLLFYHSGSYVGGLNYSNSATTLVASSDYRLKENVVAIPNAIARAKQLNPVQYNFIADPDETTEGFIAHEVGEVVPLACFGEKDAVNEDGSIKPQALSQISLIPLLTAALKEAITKIETLETKVAALEATS